MRKLKGREIELMAPAGNLEIFREIVKSNCDAIFLGGIQFQMRRIRQGYNFSNEDLVEVMKLAKEYDKKVYITLNILVTSYEIEELKDYLRFLDELQPSAIIIQDLAVVALIKELGLKNLKIHTSIQMNTHDVETIKLLQEQGIEKVVLSRECSAEDIKGFYDETNMDFEYFCYGEMCPIKDAQCNASSFVFGNNSGRGRCFKVCRWNYKLEHNDVTIDPIYPLSIKDLSVFEYIEELFDSGVTTFKIEGRMRDAEFLVPIINCYGDAIDHLIENGTYDKDDKILYDTRLRDLSTGYVMGDPKLENVNLYRESEIRKFSQPSEIQEVSEETTKEIIELIGSENKKEVKPLSVYVSSLEALKVAVDECVSRVYISDEFSELNVDELKAVDRKGTEIFYATPRSLDNQKIAHIEKMLDTKAFDGLLYTTLGMTRKFKGHKLVTDTTLLVYNHKSLEYVIENFNTDEACACFELTQLEFSSFIKNAKHDTEVLVHGILPIMYTPRNLFDYFDEKDVVSNKMELISEGSNFDLVYDRYNMSHILPQKELCLQEVVGELQKYECIKHLRIDGRFYEPEEVRTIIKAYKDVMENDNFVKYETQRGGLTYGALTFKGN